MHLHPGLAGFDANLQHGRGVGGVDRLPDAVALGALATAFGVAGVIGEDLPGPVPGRKVQQEDLRPVQGAVGARGHAHLAEELAVEHRFRFKAGAEADLGHPVPARQQFGRRLLHPHAPQPLGRGQMGMVAQQVAQLGQADAGGFRQRRRIGEVFGAGRDAGGEPGEQGHVLVFATIEKVGTAALAGPQARGLGLGFGGEDADIFRLGRAGGTGRQAVDARGHHPDDPLAVELAGPGLGTVPGHGGRKLHGPAPTFAASKRCVESGIPRACRVFVSHFRAAPPPLVHVLSIAGSSNLFEP